MLKIRLFGWHLAYCVHASKSNTVNELVRMRQASGRLPHTTPASVDSLEAVSYVDGYHYNKLHDFYCTSVVEHSI